MKLRRLFPFVGIIAVFLAVAVSASAQKRVVVKFPANGNLANYNGTVTGNASVDYQINIKAGQKYRATLSSASTFLYFNVLDWGGSGDAIGDDAREVTTWTGSADTDKTYVVRVYLNRAEARRNKKPINYNLTIEKGVKD